MGNFRVGQKIIVRLIGRQDFLSIIGDQARLLPLSVEAPWVEGQHKNKDRFPPVDGAGHILNHPAARSGTDHPPSVAVEVPLEDEKGREQVGPRLYIGDAAHDQEPADVPDAVWG